MLQEHRRGGFAGQDQGGAVGAILHAQGRSHSGNVRTGDFRPTQNQSRIGKAGTAKGGRPLAQRVVCHRPRAATPWMVFGHPLRGLVVPVSHRANGHRFETAS